MQILGLLCNYVICNMGFWVTMEWSNQTNKQIALHLLTKLPSWNLWNQKLESAEVSSKPKTNKTNKSLKKVF